MKLAQRTACLAGLFAGAGALLFFSGCSRDEIQVYRVPKETPMKLARTQAPAEVHLHWETPEGWEEIGADGLRAASFLVRSPEGQQAQIRVVPLSGMANLEIESVNMWRGELGLNPLEPDQLTGSAQPVQVGPQTGRLYDLSGDNEARIVAAVVVKNGTTWFFRMSGADPLVAQEKPRFREFLQTITFHEGSHQHEHHHDHHDAHASAPSSQAQQRPSATLAAQSSPPSHRLPEWQAPEHWNSAPLTPMLLARFFVSDDHSQAEITVSSFPGDVGGLLANVNRWRSQIGLQPIDQATLRQVTSPIELHGEYVTLVDMTNEQPAEPREPQRVLVVIVPREGHTWFYKIQGKPSLVAQEKETFIQFVQSVRYAPLS